MRLDDLETGIGLALALALVLLLSCLEYLRRVDGQARLQRILARFVLPPMLLAFVLFALFHLSRLG